MATIYTEPLSTPRRNPTANHAIARADTRDPVIERGGVRYGGEAKVRRGKDRLEVTLLDAVKWPLRWECGATG